MRDIDLVESAHRQLKQFSYSKSLSCSKARLGGADSKKPVPEIGNVHLRKLTQEITRTIHGKRPLPAMLR